MKAARKLRVVENCPVPETPIKPVVYVSQKPKLTPLQRDKCVGRRLISSGGNFGITYARPARASNPIKRALAAFPFVALVTLLIVAALH